MKTLEQILQEYFGANKVFLKSGTFSNSGMKAYVKLDRLLLDLSLLGISIDYNKVIKELDRIEHEVY